MALLSGPEFIVVRSEILPPSLLIWTATNHDRDLLIAHGAPPETVYTYDELEILARVNPDPQALAMMHCCKALFGGRLIHCRDRAVNSSHEGERPYDQNTKLD